MRNILSLALILFCLFPFHTDASELNAGFVDGLWFSEEPVFADTAVRIYVALRNNSESDLTGTVRFYADEKLIGTKTISAVAGRLVEAWTDWTPSYGEATLRAELEKVQQHKVGERAEAATVTSNLAEETIFVDYDTDKDGTGNEDDLDDDNDGASDVLEKERGTDPLTPEKKPAPTPAPQAAAASNGDETTKTSTRSNTEPQGLEQLFKEDDRGQAVFAGFTETINTAKKNIDAYREARTEAAKPAATTSVDKSPIVSPASPESSTATITRTMLPRKPGLFDTAGDVLASLTDSLFTLVLFLASLALSNPALVQFALLVGILLLAVTFAGKFGRRRFK